MIDPITGIAIAVTLLAVATLLDLAEHVRPRRLAMLGAALALLVLVPGCGTVSGRLGREPQPPGVDQAVVLGLICRGEDVRARDYVALRGGSVADQVEREERARRDMAEGKCPPLCTVTGGAATCVPAGVVPGRVQ